MRLSDNQIRKDNDHFKGEIERSYEMEACLPSSFLNSTDPMESIHPQRIYYCCIVQSYSEKGIAEAIYYWDKENKNWYLGAN